MPNYLITLTKEFDVVVTAESVKDAEEAVYSAAEMGEVDRDWGEIDWEVSSASETNEAAIMGVVNGECVAIEDYNKGTKK